MKTQQILTADVLDILFEGRNKAYGAYMLRKNYNKRLQYALASTFMLTLLLITLSIWAKKENTSIKPLEVKDIILSDHSVNKPDITPPIEKPKEQVKALVKQVIFTTPTIVKNHLYDDQTPPPDQSSLDNVVIGTVNTDGFETGNTIVSPIEATGTGSNAEIIAKKDYEEDFKVVQIPATFPGGQESWKRYLEKNLNRELPSENGAAPGIYSVIVSFLVDKDGNISDAQTEKDPGFGTAEEAIRIIKKGPKWSPAIQNGQKVVYRVKQTISFVVESEK